MFRKSIYAVALAFMAISYIVIIGGSSSMTPSSSGLPNRYPLVYVYPEEVVADVGQTFTINVMVYNLTDAFIIDWYSSPVIIPLGNLYGFDVQMTWDSSIIKYVSHTVTVPVETFDKPIYPSNDTGVLHGPIFEMKDIVNETGIPVADPLAKAWFAYSGFPPALPFNGNGVILNMTFRVLKPGVSPIQFVDGSPSGTYVRLADYGGNAIGWSWTRYAWLNPPRGGIFRTPGMPVADFTVSPGIGAANGSMHFDASVHGNLTSVQTYTWNFGDGTRLNTTIPATDHVYTRPMWTTASLVVTSESGLSSANATREVVVVASRDLAIKLVDFVGGNVALRDTLKLRIFAFNFGNPGVRGRSFFENAVIALYYNTSRVDSNTIWVEAGMEQTMIESGNLDETTFRLKSTALPMAGAWYQFKLNVSGIPSGYEANMTNNEVISAQVYLEQIGSRASDFNGDGTVDVLDLVMAVNAYGSRPGDAKWNLAVDIAPPYRVIDIRDLVTCTAHYGEIYT